MEPLRQDGSQQVPDADGEMLAGRYRLVSLIGRGGMGAVWRALDEQLGREVAVKELRLPEQLDDDARRTWIARLDREARAAAGLRHPGIVTVYDRVTGDDGRPWIVMELVRGRSLADLLASEGRLPPVQAARIGLRLLEALRAAHRAGITHRDLKPANVLLEDDRVFLTDFGIAAVEGDATLTGTGVVLGTPAYMSPEQVRGREVTPAADLWSLGATLYTAVEGRPPFEGAGAGAVFIAVATEEPAPPVHAGPLEGVLRDLLRREPAERPAPENLQARLAEIAQGSPPVPPPRVEPAPVPPTLVQPPGEPPVPQPPRRPARPRGKWRIAVIAAAASVALLALAVAGDWALGTYRQWQQDRRYEANMDFIGEMGPLPGESPDISRGWRVSTVEVWTPLCVYTSDDDDDCNLQSQATAIADWFRSRPGVTSVDVGPETQEPNNFPGHDLRVSTRSSVPEISDVVVFDRNQQEIILAFDVG